MFSRKLCKMSLLLLEPPKCDGISMPCVTVVEYCFQTQTNNKSNTERSSCIWRYWYTSFNMRWSILFRSDSCTLIEGHSCLFCTKNDESSTCNQVKYREQLISSQADRYKFLEFQLFQMSKYMYAIALTTSCNPITERGGCAASLFMSFWYKARVFSNDKVSVEKMLGGVKQWDTTYIFHIWMGTNSNCKMNVSGTASVKVVLSAWWAL